jgi:hypothetical protein
MVVFIGQVSSEEMAEREKRSKKWISVKLIANVLSGLDRTRPC